MSSYKNDIVLITIYYLNKFCSFGYIYFYWFFSLCLEPLLKSDFTDFYT